MEESSKWSDFEKRRLFGALQRYGPDDIKQLQNKAAALHEKKNESDNKKGKDGESDVSNTNTGVQVQSETNIKNPLNDWLDAISESCSSEYLKTLLPDALRLIAHLEKRPKTRVDLKSLYLSLADILSGKSTNIPDGLFESLQRVISDTNSTALREKREYLQNITRIFPDHREMNVPSPTDSVETKAVLKLQSSATYNPLAIPITFLETESFQ